MKHRESIFFIVISFFVSIFILFVLLDFDANWMHPEVVKLQMPYIFENGRNLQPTDFLRCFNCYIFDSGNPRPRFLSHLFQIINLKFRNYLFNFILPHPSLSLTWIFTLILSPIFLFKLVYNLTSSRTTSWISVLLYAVSPGALSLVTLLFHPGKPLSNFFAIFCLYLASRINLSVNSKGIFQKTDLRLYITLLITLFIVFLIDENSYFIFLCIPILFPSIFRIKDKGRLIFLIYSFIFVLHLGFVVFIVPAMIRHMGLSWSGAKIAGFNFAGFIIYVIARLSVQQQTLWGFLSLENIFLNGHYLFSSHIVPFRSPDLSNFYRLDIYVYILFFFYCLYLFKLLPHPEKRLLKRASAALLLLVLFHFFLFMCYSKVTPDCYYYGTFFSLFLAIPLSILLSVKAGFLKIVNRIIFILLLAVFASNFYTINQRWNYSHSNLYKFHFSKEIEEMPDNKILTYPMVLKAWQSRNNASALLELKKQFPKRSYWLFAELDYLQSSK